MKMCKTLSSAAWRTFAIAGIMMFIATASGCSQNCCAPRCDGQKAGKCASKCDGKSAAKCGGKCDGKCDKSKSAGKSAAVNTKCPMTGGPANPKVTVVSGGKTVAFCCGGCIGRWNALSADEQAKKLAAAM